MMKHGQDIATTSMFDVRVIILFACTFLLSGEGPLLSPHLTEIAEEFGMSEQERDEKLGGEIALGLVLLGGLCAFPLGLMADRYSRKLLLEADERKIRERGGGGADAPVARHSWLASSKADLDSEFREAAADETTSLLHRREAAPSRFDTGQFSFRDAAQ